MNASDIQNIVDQENDQRKAIMLSTAKSLITTITSTQSQIAALRIQIENARKQLKSLSYTELNTATIMEET